MIKFREKAFINANKKAFKKMGQIANFGDNSKNLFKIYAKYVLNYYDKINLETIEKALEIAKNIEDEKEMKMLKKVKRTYTKSNK